jgi:hypothetical protein
METGDLQWIFTDHKAEVPSLCMAAKQDFLATLTMARIDAATSDSNTFRWEITSKQATGTTKGEVPLQLYNISTAQGHCGFPVRNAAGQLVAVHLYGSLREGTSMHNAGQIVTARPQEPARSVLVTKPFSMYAGCYDGVLDNNISVRLADNTAVELFPELQKSNDPPGPAKCLHPVAPPMAQGIPCPGEPLRQVWMQEYQRYSEGFKIWEFREDVNLEGFHPRRVYAKPGTDTNKLELQRFGDSIDYNMDKGVFAQAVACATIYDAIEAPITTQFADLTESLVLSTIDTLDLSKSSGVTGRGMSAKDYITALGDGEWGLGRIVLARNVMRLWQCMLNEEPTPEDIQFIRHHCCWMVIGKKDGYAPKKIPPRGNCRTIQAPCLEMKVLWSAVVGSSDAAWMDRGGAPGTQWIHSGRDDASPVADDEVQAIMCAVGAFAGDVKGYDRYMTRPFIRAFFKTYMPHVLVGVPSSYWEWMYMMTVYGPLVCSDGTVLYKERGNPSGFFNTLRLNNVTHLMAFFYVILRRNPAFSRAQAVEYVQKNFLLKICGDDSRHLALTEAAAEFLDLRNGAAAYLEIWNAELPWMTTVEGQCLFEGTLAQRCAQCPPMVSRKYVHMGGRVWELLMDTARCIKRLMCKELNRPVEMEAILRISAFTTLAHHVTWFLEGRLYDSTVEFLIREFGTPELIGISRKVVADYARTVDTREFLRGLARKFKYLEC